MPFGRFKGSQIADMDQKDIKDIFKTKEFKQNTKDSKD